MLLLSDGRSNTGLFSSTKYSVCEDVVACGFKRAYAFCAWVKSGARLSFGVGIVLETIQSVIRVLCGNTSSSHFMFWRYVIPYCSRI
jgi:hypothetical protein